VKRQSENGTQGTNTRGIMAPQAPLWWGRVIGMPPDTLPCETDLSVEPTVGGSL
jgi:hypothetical protein